MNHTTDRVDQGIDIERALQTLDGQARDMVILHCLHGYTQAEIGEMMGMAPQRVSDTIADMLYQVRRQLT